MAVIYRKAPDNVVSLGDRGVYKLQRRPGHPQVLINDRSNGVRTIDPWTGRDEAHITFSPQYARQGIIDAWCFRSDGNALIAMNEEQRIAALLTLTPGEKSYDLEAPPFRVLQNLRYLWDSDSFLISRKADEPQFTLTMEGGCPTFVEISRIRGASMSSTWRYLQRNIPPVRCNVERVVPDESCFLWYTFGGAQDRIGVLDCKHQTGWSVPAPCEVARAAFYDATIFVAFEYEVRALDSEGVVRVAFSAPEGCHFHDLDTVPPANGQPPALVVGCNGLDPSVDDRLLVFAIDDRLSF